MWFKARFHSLGLGLVGVLVGSAFVVLTENPKQDRARWDGEPTIPPPGGVWGRGLASDFLGENLDVGPTGVISTGTGLTTDILELQMNYGGTDAVIDSVSKLNAGPKKDELIVSVIEVAAKESTEGAENLARMVTDTRDKARCLLTIAKEEGDTRQSERLLVEAFEASIKDDKPPSAQIQATKTESALAVGARPEDTEKESDGSIGGVSSAAKPEPFDRRWWGAALLGVACFILSEVVKPTLQAVGRELTKTLAASKLDTNE